MAYRIVDSSTITISPGSLDGAGPWSGSNDRRLLIAQCINWLVQLPDMKTWSVSAVGVMLAAGIVVHFYSASL